MTNFQRRSNQGQETDLSPAVEFLRRSSVFNSNLGFENSARQEQLKHLQNAGAMCIPGQTDFSQSTWYQEQAMSMGTSDTAHDDHDHDHDVEPEPIVTPLTEFLPLANGSRGEGVKLLQAALNALGADLVVDGSFGPASAAAVEIFQVANGLSRSGTVDEATAIALYGESPKTLQQAQLEGVPGQFVGTFDAWQNGRHIGDIDVVELDGKKVAVKTARAWETLKNAAAADGIHLQLNSGFRTMPEQRHLYQKYGAPRAATPGYSNHQHGQALDIDAANPEHKRWLFDNAPGFGWRNTVSFEPWHWEYFGD